MQGILKSNHEKLCNCLKDIKAMHPVLEPRLAELEVELSAIFKSYKQKMGDLKNLISLYEEKEKSIKNEIKRIRKDSIVVLKKAKTPVLKKIAVLVILSLQNIFVCIETGLVCSAIFY